MLTLGQAAKETGFSKPTISKAIKNGRLSAIKNDDGSFDIDPAELFRVYPPNSKPMVTTLQKETGLIANSLQRELEILREERDRERKQSESERDDLRRRLDKSEAAREREAAEREKVAEELRRLTLLITQHPERQAPPKAKVKPEQVKVTLWQSLFGRR